jgi:flagellar basal-body rod protein FlgB
LSPIYIIDLAAQHARWASARQAAVTGNIANANTVGYTALDVAPFSAVLDAASAPEMARTSPQHLGAAGTTGESFAVSDSGNAVSLDRELVKADEVNRAYALDTSIMRAFQRMMVMSVRSGS